MFEPRGHDVMSGSILYEPMRDDTDAAILFIETSGCLPMCGHGTIGTVTVLIEEGLVTPKREGQARPRGAGRHRRGRLQPRQPRQRRRGPHPQRPVLPLPDRPDGRRARISASSASTSPMAAISTRSSSRRSTIATSTTFRPSTSSACRRSSAALINEKYDFVHPENPTITGLRHILWAGRPHHPEARCPQRRLLRREGDRPLALRHRHLGPHGAEGGARRARGRRRFRPRIDHRQPVPRPRRGEDEGRRRSTRSCPRSPARPGSPATTPSSSTTATPS